jgi:plasmid stabilization system protein ParE
MKYEVVLTDRALRDLDEAYRWFAQRAPEAAARWYKRKKMVQPFCLRLS